MFTRAKTNLSGGIVGLANVGKSTLFQAMTRSDLGNPGNYPFATIDPEEGRVAVPSPGLMTLAEIYQPNSLVAATFKIIDIAGLVRGAASGQGLGNAFLSHIKMVDGLFQVVRCFDDADVVHVENSVDPVRDAQIIHDELVLKDMEFVMKALDAATKRQKKVEASTYEEAMKVLDAGKRIDSSQSWTPDQAAILRQLSLLTTKPSVFVANISEEDYCFGDPQAVSAKLNQWVHQCSRPGDIVIPVSVNLEARLASLTEQEGISELQELGVTSSIPKVIQALRSALGLHSFFTAGKDEVREWTISQGSTAPQAAGAIHTDFQKTFITAQVAKVDDLVKVNGDESSLKKQGRLQMKGKDYVVEDGDVLTIKAGAANK